MNTILLFIVFFLAKLNICFFLIVNFVQILFFFKIDIDRLYNNKIAIIIKK